MSAGRLKCDLLTERFCRPWLIGLLLATGADAAESDEYRWQYRLLMVVAPAAADLSVQEARRRLEHRADELAERDVMVMQLFTHGQSQIGDRPVTAGEAGQIRERISVGPESKLLVLVGKDGTIKRRASLSTNLLEIFDEIDAMPICRMEMR